MIDAATGTVVHNLIPEEVLAVLAGSQGTFNPDGGLLVTAAIPTDGSPRGELLFFDANTFEPAGAPWRVNEGFLGDVVYSPNGAILAIVSVAPTNHVRPWDARSREPLSDMIPLDRPPHQVAFSPDGRFLVATDIDNSVLVWDVAGNAPAGEPLDLKTTGTGAGGLAFAPDGRLFINASGTVTAWDLLGRSASRSVFPQADVAAELSRDGSRIVSIGATASAQLSVFDAVTGELLLDPIVTPELPAMGVPPVISRDGALAITQHTSCGGNRVDPESCDVLLQVWDLAGTGRLRGEILLNPTLTQGVQLPNNVALSRDAALLAVSDGSASGGSGAVRVHDTTTLELTTPPLDDLVPGTMGLFSGLALGQREGVRLLAVSLFLAEGGAEDGFAVWSLGADGATLLAEERSPTQAQIEVFTGNGLLIVLPDESVVELRDPHTLEIVVSLPTVGLTQGFATVSGDGKTLLLGGTAPVPAGGSSPPGPALLWDVALEERVGEPFSLGQFFSLSGDGRSVLITGTGDATIWTIDPDLWESEACQAAGRNLTLAEWEEFLPPGEPDGVTCSQWPAVEAP